MIRTHQQQLTQLQNTTGHTQSTTAIIDDSTPGPDNYASPAANPEPAVRPSPGVATTPRSPLPHTRSSHEIVRARSRTHSQTTSPGMRPNSFSRESSGAFSLNERSDEGALYLAETQMMVRENQVLRLRIRELGLWSPSTLLHPVTDMSYYTEKQVSELHANSAITHEPVTHSNLVSERSRSTSDGTDDTGRAAN